MNHLSPALAAMRTAEADQRRASLLDRIETADTARRSAVHGGQ